jgi:hypothetical protein
MLNVIMLIVLMLSVIMLNVVMLSVVAPFFSVTGNCDKILSIQLPEKLITNLKYDVTQTYKGCKRKKLTAKSVFSNNLTKIY